MVGPPQDDAAERLVRASRRDRLGDAADDLVSDDAEAHDDAVGDALRVEEPGGDAVLHRAPDAVAADVDVVGRLAAADMDAAAPGIDPVVVVDADGVRAPAAADGTVLDTGSRHAPPVAI